MPDRYIDPAAHTMLAASVIAIVNTGCLETVKYGYYGDTVNFFCGFTVIFCPARHVFRVRLTPADG